MNQLATHKLIKLPSQAPSGAFNCLAFATAGLAATLSVLVLFSSSFGVANLLYTLILWAAITTTIWKSLAYHTHEEFGDANRVTTARAASTALLAGFIPAADQITSPAWLWIIAILATIALCMDGLDGYLARKSGLSSAFGARFDMETDALLALIITLLLWQSEKLGIWVLGLGVMRYVFIAAAHWCKALRAELFPSLRRKTVCVIQVGALCLMLCPVLSVAQATVVGATALLCLGYSFAVDVLWLLQNAGNESAPANPSHEK